MAFAIVRRGLNNFLAIQYFARAAEVAYTRHT